MLTDKESKRWEMESLLTMPSIYNDDINKKLLANLWGNSLEKLTPKQRQLVIEILSNQNS